MAGFKVAASRPGDLSNAHSKQNSDRDRVGGRAQHRRRVRFRGGRSGGRRYEAGDNDGRTRRQGHDGARRYDDDSGDKKSTTPSPCKGLDNPTCTANALCSWYKEAKLKDGHTRKAHCQKKPTHVAKPKTAPKTAPKTTPPT